MDVQFRGNKGEKPKVFELRVIYSYFGKEVSLN